MEQSKTYNRLKGGEIRRHDDKISTIDEVAALRRGK